MLEAWLDPAINTKIMKGKPYMCYPAVKKFLQEIVLKSPVNSKRQCIDLAGPSSVSPKKAASLGGPL